MMSRSAKGMKQYPQLFAFFLRFRNIPVRDLYTIQMEDVQVFVEKRRNVFNFHLLDESLDIPDPSKVMDSLKLSSLSPTSLSQSISSPVSPPLSHVTGGETNSTYVPDVGLSPDNHSPIHSGRHNGLSTSTSLDSSPAKKNEDSVTKQTANDIYTHMLGAVSNISRAVNEGKGISSALKHQKDGFVRYANKFFTAQGVN
jgi:hypothetical protein